MNSPTPEYKNLKISLRNVTKILSRVPETENTTTLHHLKVQSFVFLAHAAFEEYLENLASSLMKHSVYNYNTKSQINETILGLITFETVAQFDKETPRKEISFRVVKNTKKYLNLAKTNHEGVISSNHGIKLKDQKAILLPVGIDPEEVDIATSASLDAFGIKRGGFAHTFKIQTNDTRSSVLAATHNIFIGLKSFDEEACRIMSAKAAHVVV
jgi:hypothetical protein